MTPDEAKSLLIEVVSELQVQSCRDLPPIHGGTRLRGDVPGCDSVAVVEIGIHLSERLASRLGGCDLPDRLLLGTRQHSPTIDEIAGEVAVYVSRKEKRNRKAPSCSRPQQEQGGTSADCVTVIDAEPQCNRLHEVADGSISTDAEEDCEQPPQTQEPPDEDHEKDEQQN